MRISSGERAILRDMARRQSDLAHSEAMRALRRQWEAAGAFASDARPMICIELWTFSDDIIPSLMRCEGEDARALERMLHGNVVNHLLFGDDTLVRSHFAVPIRQTFIPFGLPVRRQETSAARGGGLGHRFIAQLRELTGDFHRLGPSVMKVDLAGTRARVDALNELFGDILPVRMEHGAMGASPMQDIVHIMDMEDMYVAMLDEPELFHRMLGMLTDDYTRRFEQLEAMGVLNPTGRDEHLAQGSYCYTNDLPANGKAMRLKDLWLYMDSQETAGVSPAMFREFVMPHYKKIASRFGLLSYGCCEAVHSLWEDGIDQFDNLRKVSVSPWCDEPFMGEMLRGRKVVYHRKPSPNLLGVGAQLDEDAVRAHIRATAEAARGCLLEIAQRDVYRISNTPDKVRRYVQLIRETVDTYWRR